jgi:tRNA G10  N-methylase Trm11
MFAKNHPFHVSILEIKINEEKKLIEISQRVFIDDFEFALKSFAQREVSVIGELHTEKLDSLVRSYLLEHITITTDKKLDIHYLGYEQEEESLWIFSEIPFDKKINEITVNSKILINEYDDQQNIVHLTIGEKIKSTSLSNENTEKKFILSVD